VQRQIDFEISADDYVAANRLHARLIYFSWRGLRALVIVWLLYTLVAVAIGGQWTLAGILPILAGTAIGTPIIALAILGINALLLARRTRRLFDQQRSLHGKMMAKWNEAGLQLTSPNGSGIHEWSDFIKWAESKTILLFYQNDMLFNLVPQRALDAEQLEDIKTALRAQGVRQAGRPRTDNSA